MLAALPKAGFSGKQILQEVRAVPVADNRFSFCQRWNFSTNLIYWSREYAGLNPDHIYIPKVIWYENILPAKSKLSY